MYYFGARYYDPKVSIWLSVDPLAKKYPNWSPYVYCLNNPVRLIDPDGREPIDPPKVILLFYHGGPDGNGKIHPKTGKGQGYTSTLYNKATAGYKSKGSNVVGAVIAPAATQGTGVETGVDFVSKNYKKGDTVIIYGYSYGGDNAVNAAEGLADKGISVNKMVLVDNSDGPLKNNTVDATIPDNVKSTLNIYQTDPSGNIGNPSDGDDNSDFGPGSRGYPAFAEGKNKVINKNVTKKGTSHGNIEKKNESTILKGLGVE